MGILKDAGESLMKYGEIIVNKTEEYTKIAKLNLDIKRLESDIGNTEKEIGRYVIKKVESGEKTINGDDASITKLISTVKSIKQTIKSKKAEIEKIKKAKSNKNTTNRKSQPDPEKKDSSG